MPSRSKPLLRDGSAADTPFLDSLFFALHRDEFLPLGLPEAQLLGLLAMQARAQRLGYTRDFPEAVDRIIFEKEPDGERPLGRLIASATAAELRLVDIALLPEQQGRGLGTALIEDLQRQAASRRVPLRLQVRPGNPAFRLYSRLGFRLQDSVPGASLELSMEWIPDELRGAQAEDASPKATAEAPSALGRHWQQRVGGRFRATPVPEPAEQPAEGKDDQQDAPELVLSRMDWHGPVSTNRFTLIFQGPLEPVLPQATYTLRPSPPRLSDEESRETVDALFLVATGPEAGRMLYEAVFNS
jgi:ribosomal protein S18 acetylase RimI-like enzyme